MKARRGRDGAGELLRRLHADQGGQVTLEWVLILAAVALPLLAVFRLCLAILVSKYRMMMFVNSLPCP